MQPTIVVAVKSLLIHNDKALIIQRSPSAEFGAGIWEFAGGKLEFGETLEECLLREIKEETGLTARMDKLLYAVTLPTGPTRQIVVLNYLTHLVSGSVTLSHEHQNYLWATRQEMLSMLDSDIVENLVQHNVFAKVNL